MFLQCSLSSIKNELPGCTSTFEMCANHGWAPHTGGAEYSHPRNGEGLVDLTGLEREDERTGGEGVQAEGLKSCPWFIFRWSCGLPTFC